MSIADRRAAFNALVACYHNSFENVKEGATKHSPQFIRKALLSEAGRAALQLDPRLTSTNAGAVAVGIARNVMTSEKAARAFIDVEISEGAFIVSFDNTVNADAAYGICQLSGTAAVLCKSGDKIGEGLTSDLLILAVEPTQAVSEAYVAAEKGRVDEAKEPYDAEKEFTQDDPRDRQLHHLELDPDTENKLRKANVKRVSHVRNFSDKSLRLHGVSDDGIAAIDRGIAKLGIPARRRVDEASVAHSEGARVIHKGTGQKGTVVSAEGRLAKLKMDNGDTHHYPHEILGSLKEAEVGPIDKETFHKAEKAAIDQYGAKTRDSNPDKFYAITMSIYKKMKGVKEDEVAKPDEQGQHDYPIVPNTAMAEAASALFHQLGVSAATKLRQEGRSPAYRMGYHAHNAELAHREKSHPDAQAEHDKHYIAAGNEYDATPEGKAGKPVEEHPDYKAGHAASKAQAERVRAVITKHKANESASAGRPHHVYVAHSAVNKSTGKPVTAAELHAAHKTAATTHEMRNQWKAATGKAQHHPGELDTGAHIGSVSHKSAPEKKYHAFAFKDKHSADIFHGTTVHGLVGAGTGTVRHQVAERDQTNETTLSESLHNDVTKSLSHAGMDGSKLFHAPGEGWSALHGALAKHGLVIHDDSFTGDHSTHHRGVYQLAKPAEKTGESPKPIEGAYLHVHRTAGVGDGEGVDGSDHPIKGKHEFNTYLTGKKLKESTVTENERTHILVSTGDEGKPEYYIHGSGPFSGPKTTPDKAKATRLVAGHAQSLAGQEDGIHFGKGIKVRGWRAEKVEESNVSNESHPGTKYHTIAVWHGSEGAEMSDKMDDKGTSERAEHIKSLVNDYHDPEHEGYADDRREHPAKGLGSRYRHQEVQHHGATYGMIWNPHHEIAHLYKHVPAANESALEVTEAALQGALTKADISTLHAFVHEGKVTEFAEKGNRTTVSFTHKVPGADVAHLHKALGGHEAFGHLIDGSSHNHTTGEHRFTAYGKDHAERAHKFAAHVKEKLGVEPNVDDRSVHMSESTAKQKLQSLLRVFAMPGSRTVKEADGFDAVLAKVLARTAKGWKRTSYGLLSESDEQFAEVVDEVCEALATEVPKAEMERRFISEAAAITGDTLNESVMQKSDVYASHLQAVTRAVMLGNGFAAPAVDAALTKWASANA